MDPRNRTYVYRAFGLNIRSEIEFPELLSGGGEAPDILISRTSGPTDAWTGQGRNAWRFDMQRFRLRLDGIADYEVQHGSRISVCEVSGADPAQVRIHLLTVCMAAALMQRGQVLLHASGIVRNGRCILFAGDSGAGKSSAAAEMRKRGYRLLADDTCLVQARDGEAGNLIVHPSYPMLKLTSEALDSLGDPRYDKGLRIWPDTEKFGQLLHGDAPTEGAALAGILIIGFSESDERGASHRRLHGNEAFLSLARHTYRKEFIHEAALQQAHLKTMGSVASEVPVMEATRPRSMPLDSFCDLLERCMGECLGTGRTGGL